MISSAFRDAVAAGDLLSVRIMMKNSLRTDPSGREFDAMAAAAAGLEGLYDLPSGDETVVDPQAWTEDEVDRVLADLPDAFTCQRIEQARRAVAAMAGPGDATTGGARPAGSFPRWVAGGASVGLVVGAGAAALTGAGTAVIIGAGVLGAGIGAACGAALRRSADRDGG